MKLPDRGPGQEYYDRKPMIIDDLRVLPVSPLIVADGPLTPRMAKLRPEIASQAVWLMPSKEVQHARLRIRHPEGVPPAYLKSWEPMAEHLEETTITTITVDHLTVDETIGEIERVFAAYIAKGPTAASLDERRSLIRYGNQALVAQYTSPSARPRVPVKDPGRVVRTFDCECAASSCDLLVELRVGDAAAAVRGAPSAILATGH
ncbi:hypothetical protein [Actinopolymorpha alba]|uniref:hypothetical protein n=1 Tax=Actinopolymorpha alba TaxID=533267 RepID=UPI0012F653BB|nr:hypothetical protein [Actinopolymorpha alba]